MESSFSSNFTLYLMLVVCVILLAVDSYELYKISISWSHIPKFDAIIFNTCLKKDLLIKTIYSVFSCLAAICAFLLTLFLTVSIEYFLDKLLLAFLYFAYVIFGPLMLGFTIYGFIKWEEVVYVCNRKNFTDQIFSLSNAVSIIGCFIISLVVTLGVAIYESVLLYINSITRRESGSKILRSVFWWFIMRASPNSVRNFYGRREQQGEENNRINNQNV
jgi:hypothetical protein